MGTQVNNLTGKQALQAVKDYVDKQATAHVIRTETVLWNGDFRFSTSTPTPVVNDGDYKSFKGDTTNAGIVLSSAISDFDAIGLSLYVSVTNDNRFLSVEYVEIPVENLIVDGHFPINYATLFANFTNNNMAMTGIGLTATHRIGFGDWLVSNTNWRMGVNKITGIKYTVPENYSTDEQIIGTWIDGKALYRRVIEIPEVQAVDRNWTLLLTDPTFLNTIDKLISAKFLTPIGTHLPLDTKIQDGKFYLWVYPGGDRINTIIIEYTKTGGA